MLKILVVGVSDRTIDILKRIRHLKEFHFVGVLCPGDKAVTLSAMERIAPALEELSIPLLTTAPAREKDRPDLVLNMLNLSAEALLESLGEKILGRCSVMSFPAMDTFLEMVQNYATLKETRAMLSEIIGSTHDAISVVDAEGKGLIINRAYTRLTGLTEDDIIGKPASVDIAEGESTHLKVLRDRKPLSDMRMKVGPRKKDVVTSAAPIIVDGQLRGSVGVIHDVSEIIKLTEELNKVKRLMRQLNARYTFADLITGSRIMQEAMQKAEEASATPATVLLVGESGTGKELFAHAIHNASPRADGPFMRVNCSAIADSLMESELFGYVEGAFTGAKKGGRKGLIEEASTGTLFLDEIGKMNLKVQAELLRVLQEKEITRVGDTRPVSVDVRVIVATNTALEKMIGEGTFREDLFYRLNVVPIVIPPLRERKEDIPLLVHHLIRKFNQEYGRAVESMAPGALELLQGYDWPGNVRELENIVGRAMISVGFGSDVIAEEHLTLPGRPAAAAAGPQPVADGLRLSDGELRDRPLREILDRVEKEVILRTLKACGGNKTDTARKLGIAIRNLYYKLEKYGDS